MYQHFQHGQQLKAMAVAAEEALAPRFRRIAAIVEENQARVLRAFQHHHVSESHFAGSAGYGYDDVGRDVIEHIYAEVFGAEDALVRPHFVSGTHAIVTALFGVLRPGDELLFVTGEPYDSLQQALGLRGKSPGNLLEFGIACRVVPLKDDGQPDWNGIQRALTPKVKVVAMQRSRGYSWRPTFTVEELAQINRFVKEIRPDVITFVDNCYGEFTEEREPTAVGVDLMAGSLIKNPGGGLAPSGGYVAGNKDLVEMAASRLTAPGLGKELGATFGLNRLILQGFFMSPHIVGEALKGAVFAARILEEWGYETAPRWNEPRSDIIQAIRFQQEDELITFCEAVQAASPVDAFVRPVPSPMPGYEDPVIMAAGTFVQGASIELSADGPVRPPYIGYMQGGLTYEHVKYAVLSFLDRFMTSGRQASVN